MTDKLSKPLWAILLTIVGFFAIWRLFFTVQDLHEHFSLSYQIPTQVKTIAIVPKNSLYALEIFYTYKFQNKEFTGSQVLHKPWHLNRRSAQRAIQSLQKMQWDVWINPKHPNQSKIEKNISLKGFVYTLVLLGVFLYFLYLRIHLTLLSRAM